MSRYSSLSVDLDNHWSYLKTHGNASWAGFPSYLDQVVPHIDDLAGDMGLDLTVFVVGQDAELEANAGAMARLGESGYEIGNHSFHHEPWLHLKSPSEIEVEIMRADHAIEAATGSKPTGFRGPGFSLSQSTIRVLDDCGYNYDASTLPTFIGPLARAFYMRQSEMGRDDLEQRSKLFGEWREVFRPLKPYQWSFTDRESSLIEVPVTTMPLLRVPFHATYLLYLARFSHSLSRAYLRTALALCRVNGVNPSILLHSLDFIGVEDLDDLGFFPGMDMSGATKRALLRDYVGLLAEFGEIVTVGEHARKARSVGPSAQKIESLA